MDARPFEGQTLFKNLHIFDYFRLKLNGISFLQLKKTLLHQLQSPPCFFKLLFYYFWLSFSNPKTWYKLDVLLETLWSLLNGSLVPSY